MRISEEYMTDEAKTKTQLSLYHSLVLLMALLVQMHREGGTIIKDSEAPGRIPDSFIM
jgi:hypothetical protein